MLVTENLRDGGDVHSGIKKKRCGRHPMQVRELGQAIVLVGVYCRMGRRREDNCTLLSLTVGGS